jgi:hypothetical protein
MGVVATIGLLALSGVGSGTAAAKRSFRLSSFKGSYAGTGTNSIDFTATTPGCTSGSYTQSLVIGGFGDLVLLSNTNGDQINEQWHLQK